MSLNKQVKHLADFGKCAVRVAQQHAQHVPVKNLMERSKSDSGYEVECKGFELPTIQDADFGKSGGAQDFCHSEYYEMFQYLRHSESIEKYYEFTNSYFSCYSESINTDEKPINVILNLIQDLLMLINNQTERFRISGTRIKRISASPYILCSCLSGMT